jgi:hypothetical protein
MRHRYFGKFGLALAAGVLIASAAPASTLALSPQTNVPAGIDASLLSTPVSGPVVATGTLRDSSGRGAAGNVAVVAWPSEKYNASHNIKVGSAVNTPVVGWTTSDASGNFTLRLDPSRVSNDYIQPDGQINLDAIGWTGDVLGRSSFAAPFAAPSAALTTKSTTSQTSVAAPAPRIDLKADQKFVPAASSTSSVPAAQGITVKPQATYPVYWVLQSTYDAPAAIGETWPWGSDTGWMKASSSHSLTVGVAASGSGTYGSWSASGSLSTSSGVTFTWAKSINYRAYYVTLQYGIYREYVLSTPANVYQARVIQPTGNHTDGAAGSQPSWNYCRAQSQGAWSRSDGVGNDFKLGGGVVISKLLGINLSVDSAYNSSSEIDYELQAYGQLCGSDNYAAYSTYVKTSR